MPSNLPGMDFMTLSATPSYKVSVPTLHEPAIMFRCIQVHFSMQDNNLMVRAQCSQTNHILQLVPSSKLREDLPPSLIDGHVHWLSLSEKVIKICPLEQPWEQSPENWRIDCSSGQYCMYKGCETLVDVQSQIWPMVSKCFQNFNNVTLEIGPFDEPSVQTSNILVTTSPTIDSAQSMSMLQLSVALPRYGLLFFVNGREELESRDFEDMVIDESQCIGALIGLENSLVLRPKTQFAGSHAIPEALVPKHILIPNGFPATHGDHQVRIYINSRKNLPGPNEPLFHTYNVNIELGCLTGDGSLTSTRFLAYLHATTTCYRPDPLTGKTGIQAALCLLRSAECRSIMKLKALFDGLYTDAGHWSSTRYPQMSVAYKEIQDRYYWDPHRREDEVHLAMKRAVQRAVHLSPLDVASTNDYEDMEYSVPESDMEFEDVVSAAASAIHCWSNGLTVDDTPLSPHDGLGIQPSNSDPVQTLMSKMHDTLEKEARRPFQLLFLLPTVAYCSPCHRTACLSMLITFAMQTHSHSVNPLMIHSDCKISDGYRPTEHVLRDYIRKHCIEGWYLTSDEGRDAVSATIKHLLKDWPYDAPPTVSLDPSYWDVAGLAADLQQLFSSCYRNRNLKNHVMHILAAPGLPALSRRVSPPRNTLNGHMQWQVNQLLSNRSVPELPPRSTLSWNGLRNNYSPGTPNDVPELDRLFSSLQPNSAFQQEYLALLETSSGARKKYGTSYCVLATDHIDALQKYYVQCRANYVDALGILKRSLGPITEHEQALEQSGHWPLITIDILLRCLACTSPASVPERWKKCLSSLALLLLELQRARRLLRFALKGLEEEFWKELENEQCDGWNPEEYPDWLLIQVRFWCIECLLRLRLFLDHVRFEETFSFVVVRRRLQ